MSEQEQAAPAAEPQGRSDIQTVTSDTLDDFNASKMGLPAEPPAEAAEDDGEGDTTPEPEAKVVEDGEKQPEPEKPPKKKNGVQERISEVVAERNAERERARQLEAELAALKAGKQPIPPADPEVAKKPNPADFDDIGLYEQAVLSYTREQILAEQRAEEQARAQQKIEQSWKDKVAAAREAIPDYDDVMANTDVEVHNAVKEAIFESDIGPQIAHHLAANPDVAAALKAMSIASQVREIGKIEAKLTKETPAAEKPAAQPSQAPAPITPIKAAASMMDNKVDADNVFHGTADEWKALRKAGKIK
jgi:hypothetical protein